MKKMIGGFTIPQLILLNILFLSLLLGYALPEWFHWRNESVYETFKKDSTARAEQNLVSYRDPIYHDSATVARIIDSLQKMHHVNTPLSSVEIININTADASQLKSLPGIGPSLARRIMQFRKKHGPFQSVQELVKVKGIGPVKLDRIKNRISISQKGEK